VLQQSVAFFASRARTRQQRRRTSLSPQTTRHFLRHGADRRVRMLPHWGRRLASPTHAPWRTWADTTGVGGEIMNTRLHDRFFCCTSHFRRCVCHACQTKCYKDCIDVSILNVSSPIRPFSTKPSGSSAGSVNRGASDPQVLRAPSPNAQVAPTEQNALNEKVVGVLLTYWRVQGPVPTVELGPLKESLCH